MNSPDAVIKVEGLVKRYGKFEAVRGISFMVTRGECFGFLGPNGAGKSTTIGMITCTSVPTTGKVWVLGHDAARDARRIKSRIGIVPQELSIHGLMSAPQNLALYGSLYGMAAGQIRRRSRKLLQIMGLEERDRELVKNYSGGMKQRLNILLAMIHEPEIIFLDEPTQGLDPQSRHRIWDVLTEMKAGGSTIFLSTHYMEEADYLCDRIAIIDDGRIIARGTPQELKTEYGGEKTLEIEVGYYEGIVAQMKCIPGITQATYDEKLVLLSSRPQEALPEVVSQLAEKDVRDIKIADPSLEDVFLGLTGRSLRD